MLNWLFILFLASPFLIFTNIKFFFSFSSVSLCCVQIQTQKKKTMTEATILMFSALSLLFGRSLSLSRFSMLFLTVFWHFDSCHKRHSYAFAQCLCVVCVSMGVAQYIEQLNEWTACAIEIRLLLCMVCEWIVGRPADTKCCNWKYTKYTDILS